MPEDRKKALLEQAGFTPDESVAERWIASDDRTSPSHALPAPGETPSSSLAELVERFGADLLGPGHLEHFGPFLGTLMKQIDTHAEPARGSLSVQVHPFSGYPDHPSKPEFWMGSGRIYLGWNRDMDENAVRDAVRRKNLEQYLNALEIRPDRLIPVPVGTVHAIRFDSFLLEWSKSVTRSEADGKDLKKATLALYDSTDGKVPRPGKEDVDGALRLMHRAGTLGCGVPPFLEPRECFRDASGNTVTRMVHSSEIVVEQLCVISEIDLSLEDRGFPVYLDQGELDVLKSGQPVDRLLAGEERFFPWRMRRAGLRNTAPRPALLYRWYRPFPSERSTPGGPER
jgi:hypothetical protein